MLIECYHCNTHKHKDCYSNSMLKAISKKTGKALCKDCANARSRAHHHANKQKANDRGVQYYHNDKDAAFTRTLTKYNITREQYDNMLEEQSGCCKICKEIPPEIIYKNATVIPEGRLAIDHNHTTGRVRGLLCRRCNIVAGYVEGKRLLLPAFNDYLLEDENFIDI